MVAVVSENNDSDRRKSPRFSTHMGALIESDNIFIAGNIRDISAGGVFFQVEHAVVDGKFVHGEKILPCMKDEEITMTLSDVKYPLHVRWAGYSRDFPGFGLQFKAEETY